MGKKKKGKRNGVKYHGLVNLSQTAKVLDAGGYAAAARLIQSGDYESALNVISNQAHHITTTAIKAGVKIKVVKTIFGKIPLISGKRHGLSVVA